MKANRMQRRDWNSISIKRVCFGDPIVWERIGAPRYNMGRHCILPIGTVLGVELD